MADVRFDDARSALLWLLADWGGWWHKSMLLADASRMLPPGAGSLEDALRELVASGLAETDGEDGEDAGYLVTSAGLAAKPIPRGQQLGLFGAP